MWRDGWATAPAITFATALGKALQSGADSWFRLGALAPISGAYGVRRVELPALLGGTVPPPYNVGYLAYHFRPQPIASLDQRRRGCEGSCTGGCRSGVGAS